MIKIGVAKESFPGERRVAIVPGNVAALKKLGAELLVQTGAGESAGFLDKHYTDQGATVVGGREELAAADLLAAVRSAGANPLESDGERVHLRRGRFVVAMCDPLGTPDRVQRFSETGASLFALEMIPRITRAQSMDVLSSMATIAGYRAVLLAAVELPKIFPMLMTAAGTIKAAKVLVLGAGVAGLQAIATARRLGGVVHAYDVRAACREQCESLGAKFVELNLETGGAEGQGGYAKDLGQDVNRRQQEALAPFVAASDVVITTAAIPGKPSPRLISIEAVRSMAPGSVIVDLAAERGGNCELSRPDERVVDHGVTLLGPTNLPSEIPQHASQMFSNNVTRFLQLLVKQGEIHLNLDDEILRETLVAHEGQVTHPRIRNLLGLGAMDDPKSATD